MTSQEFSELLDYVKSNNSWGDNMYEVCHERKRRAIKYVVGMFDSRDGTIYKIQFRSQTHGEDKDFRVENAEEIKAVYAWLDEIME